MREVFLQYAVKTFRIIILVFLIGYHFEVSNKSSDCFLNSTFNLFIFSILILLGNSSSNYESKNKNVIFNVGF